MSKHKTCQDTLIRLNNLSKEEFEKLWNDNKSLISIAKKLNTTPHIVRKFFKKLDLEILYKRTEDPSKEELIKALEDNKDKKRKIRILARLFKKSEEVIHSLIKKNRINYQRSKYNYNLKIY